MPETRIAVGFCGSGSGARGFVRYSITEGAPRGDRPSAPPAQAFLWDGSQPPSAVVRRESQRALGAVSQASWNTRFSGMREKRESWPFFATALLLALVWFRPTSFGALPQNGGAPSTAWLDGHAMDEPASVAGVADSDETTPLASAGRLCLCGPGGASVGQRRPCGSSTPLVLPD